MDNPTCRCDAYPYPHRTGGGACIECGCIDAPLCRHWIADQDPHATGDFYHVEYERAPK